MCNQVSATEVGIERDNENKMLVKPEQLVMRRTKKVKIIIEEVDILERVRQSKVKDNKIVKVVKEIKRTRVKILRDEE